MQRIWRARQHNRTAEALPDRGASRTLGCNSETEEPPAPSAVRENYREFPLSPLDLLD